MEYVITRKVDSHHTNPRYKCAVFDILKEPWFHYEIKHNVLVRADIMPTDEWALKLVEVMWKVSPSFREALRIAVFYEDWR